MATGTKSARRSTSPAKGTKQRALENGRLAWECPQESCAGLNVWNYDDETTCTVCGSPRPADVRLIPKPAPPPGRLQELGVKRAAAEASPAEVLDLQTIPVASIDESPLNPRKHFDKAEIEQLAESMRKHKQQQNLTVRLMPSGRFELIGGARRLRALKLAKIATAIVRVLDVTDAEAVELRGIENYRRQQFNAIEEATWFKQLIDLNGETQKSLEKLLGISQGQISHRLGLLDLPEDWQQRVMSGDIPPTHARHLRPWAKYPAVMAEMAGVLKHQPHITESNWKDSISRVLERCSRPMQGYWQEPRTYRQIEVRIPKEKRDDAELQLAKIPTWNNRHELRAFNIPLWDKYQQEGERKHAEREAKRRENSEKSSGSKSGQPVRSAEDVKRNAQKQREIWQKKLYGWKIRWLQTLCADRFARADDELVLRWLLFFACQRVERTARPASLAKSVETAGGKIVRGGRQGSSGLNEARMLATVPAGQFPLVARSTLSVWVTEPVNTYHAHMRPEDVEQLAGELSIDVAAEWTLRTDFLELHSTKQLQELIAEWKIGGDGVLRGRSKRGEIIDAILVIQQSTPLPCPTEVLKVKPCRLY